MPDTKIVNIKLDIKMDIQDHGDYWTVYIEPTGATLYGRTKEESIQKAKDSVEFFIQTIGQANGVDDIRTYLDYHKVPHCIVLEPVVQQGSTEVHNLSVKFEVTET